MKREPEEPQEQEDPATEKRQEPRSDAELEQVTGGNKTSQKGSAPGFGPGTAIDV